MKDTRPYLPARAVLPALLMIAATIPIGMTQARAQQGQCPTGFTELYFSDLRETRCVSQAQLRTLSLQRQNRERVNASQRAQRQLNDRQQRIQREQERLTRSPR